jgi:branched-chain amino acid transport system permease protein
MVVLGGINTRLGPILGAVFISLFPVVITINPLWQEVLFGSVFLLVIVFLPEGFVGALGRVGRHLLARRRGNIPVTNVLPAASRPSPNGDRAAVTQGFTKTPPSWAATTVAASAAQFALEARAISYSYISGVKVLDDVDFAVPRGTIHGLIGPNGSGKSTLVNLLSGDLSCQRGTISANGRRIDHMPAWQRAGLGLMRTFQTAGMVKELTARDNVGLGLFSRFRLIGARSVAWPLVPSARRDSRRMAAVATTSLLEVGLDETWARSRVADVPHGVEQLTQLAVACASQPSILILDEPLAGLSVGEVDEVSDILRRLKDGGVTIVVVEHQTRFIFDVCDGVTVLAAGALVKTGSAAEVRSDDRVREVYLGL